MNGKGDSQHLEFEKAILNTDDILGIRNTFRDKAKSLGFQKTELTLMTTAVAEVYRLFFDALDENYVKIIRITDNYNIGISVNISGKVTDIDSDETEDNSIDEVIEELDEELNKVKKVFPSFDLGAEESNKINLSLKNWVTESDTYSHKKIL